jgi:hypothetical protein
MQYSIDYKSQREWSWLEMVAQLQDEDLIKVVEGNDRRSRGLVTCSFSPRPNSYGHKMHHVLKQTGQPQPLAKLRIWDFVLRRDDGTGIRLHPNWNRTKMDSFPIEGHTSEVPTPPKGLGESAGPGTFQAYKELGNSMTLRFDPQKWKQANRGHGST